VGVSVGERLRFTGRVKTLDGEHVLKNGMTKTVAEITKGGNLRLDNGWVIPKEAGHIRHGYVETSFGSQGSTVHRAIVAANSLSGRAANQEMAYVASTRAKERVTIFTDDKESLREAIQASSHKPLALDMKLSQPAARPQDRQERHQERRRRLAVLERTRAQWNGPAPARPQPERPRPGGGNHKARTHSERARSEQQERGMDHGR
jgi:hypothetical protein